MNYSIAAKSWLESEDDSGGNVDLEQLPWN